MFGRQFRASDHRKHVLPPAPTRYAFERIGAPPRTAAGPRKQASSLTWGHETAEQSMLGEDVWFAHSGDGFNASISEESPGSGRFTVDAYTDSDLYKYLSTTEYGFESVDEAKSFVEGVFGYSRVAARKEELREGQRVSVGGRNGRITEIRGDRITVAFPGEGIDFFSAGQINTILASRTAGKCPKCDGMGRETYETDTGSLSTQTCTACGGTGQAKESSRKTADASYEGWKAKVIYDEDGYEHAETTTPSGESADSIYPMDGERFEGGELNEALEELAREWGDDAYSGTYQYNSSRKKAWNRASDLSDEELLNQFGNGPMDDDEFDVLILEVERRGLMDQWESRMASRKSSSVTRHALGLSGLSLGDEVYWYGGGDDNVDTSSIGVIVEYPAVDPDGLVHPDIAAVEWDDGEYDLVEVNELLNAEHYNIGSGYSQTFGSRRRHNSYRNR